jgi:hypothetical protein
MIGLAKNTTLVLRNTLSGTDRMPDFVDETQRIIYEVKKATGVSFTSQIRDMAAWAQQQGYTFVLYVRDDAVLTDSLKEAEKNGLIQIQYFGWP